VKFATGSRHSGQFVNASREIMTIDVSIIQDNAISTGRELRKCGKRHVIDETTSHSTKPASGQVAGYPAKAGIQWV
jgi:hypothetical protein